MMAKLGRLTPTLKRVAPAIGYAPDDPGAFDRYRRAVTPWRKWYSTARWRALRWATLRKDGFKCRMCGRLDDPRNLVCDHIAPHRGDPERFWDEAGLQTLCKSPCHDKHKQAEERQAARMEAQGSP